MDRIEFRTLKANEIEVRPGVTKYKGKAELLLYQNSRVAMQLLDEAFGMDWASDYKVLNGVVYCGIAFFNKDTNSYLWRWDCGTPSEIEENKGAAADSFKRAAVKIGIGRELYTSPRIIVECPDRYYRNDKLTERFSVTYIDYDSKRRIKDLQIVDSNGNLVFNFMEGKVLPVEEEDRVDMLKKFCRKKVDSGENATVLTKFYNYYSTKINDWHTKPDFEKLLDKWMERE